VRRKRPFGVTIIALLQALSGPTTSVSFLFGRLTLATAHGDLELNLEALIVTVLGWAIAVGLWRLKRWAWVAVMIWTGAALAGALALYFRGQPNYPLMIEHIIIVFYLNQRDVQQAFGEAPEPAEAEA
jgi:hypothetical protein